MKKLLLVLSVLLVISIVWDSKTTTIGAIVVLKEKKPGEITVQDLNGKTKSIASPKIIEELIQEDEEYFVQYRQKRWRRPILQKIEPIEDTR